MVSPFLASFTEPLIEKFCAPIGSINNSSKPNIRAFLFKKLKVALLVFIFSQSYQNANKIKQFGNLLGFFKIYLTQFKKLMLYHNFFIEGVAIFMYQF